MTIAGPAVAATFMSRTQLAGCRGHFSNPSASKSSDSPRAESRRWRLPASDTGARRSSSNRVEASSRVRSRIRTFFQSMFAHSIGSRSGASSFVSESSRARSLPDSFTTHLIATLASTMAASITAGLSFRVVTRRCRMVVCRTYPDTCRPEPKSQLFRFAGFRRGSAGVPLQRTGHGAPLLPSMPARSRLECCGRSIEPSKASRVHYRH